MSRPISRRAALRTLGGAAVALPFLEAMRPRRAYAQGRPIKRMVVFYTPNGTVPQHFWPAGGEHDFTLSPILEPLERHRQDLLILGGIDLISSLSGPGDAHQKGTGQCLTATPLQAGDFPGDAGLSAGWAGGISLDQRVAAAIGAQTRFPSLEFGVLVDGANVKSRISYRGPGRPLPPENDPGAMFDRLFSRTRATADDARRARRRRLILEGLLPDYRRLHQRVGAADRRKLDAHIEALAGIEQRLTQPGLVFEGACQAPVFEGGFDPTRGRDMPVVGRLQMDLLAMAFACDLTRVASLMWTRSASEVVYGFLGDDIREGHHALAHKGDEDRVKVAQNTRINRWYAEQLAHLIDALKAIPEGDGSVFDSTVILWTNEQARGNNHDRNDMPYVLAGGAAGALRTGRYLRREGRVAHNHLMVSLLQAMDVDADQFGDPSLGRGPLTGLT